MHCGRPGAPGLQSELPFPGEWPVGTWVGVSPSLLIHSGHGKGQRASLTPTLPENLE